MPDSGLVLEGVGLVIRMIEMLEVMLVGLLISVAIAVYNR